MKLPNEEEILGIDKTLSNIDSSYQFILGIIYFL